MKVHYMYTCNCLRKDMNCRFVLVRMLVAALTPALNTLFVMLCSQGGAACLQAAQGRASERRHAARH